MAVIVLTGMPATGKSTICKALAAHFGFPVVEKDAIKEVAKRLGVPKSEIYDLMIDNRDDV
jgi:dephospho-CoA kinase